jgi:TonB family C-terminal domain
MKKYFFILFLFCSQFAIGQQIANAVMVGDNGITEDIAQAKYLIVIKTSSDTAFERLEYHFTGPMMRFLTYKDSLLKILNGPYKLFFPSGYVSTKGAYLNNKKDGSWYTYSNSGKPLMEYKYHLDTLLAALDIDSLEAERKKIKVDTSGEHEAEYAGGQKSYTNYINKNLIIPERTQILEAGGTVRVRFIIDKKGNVTNVHIWKSVEFAFDEEVIRIVSSAKGWKPAIQQGRNVDSYREQPVTISFK